MSKEFSTRWAFTCGCCGDNQPAGTVAEYGPDGVLRCVEPDHTPGDGPETYTQPSGDQRPHIDVMPHGKTALDRCDGCFIIHASGQTECY